MKLSTHSVEINRGTNTFHGHCTFQAAFVRKIPALSYRMVLGLYKFTRVRCHFLDNGSSKNNANGNQDILSEGTWGRGVINRHSRTLVARMESFISWTLCDRVSFNAV